jgi:hypothetical protein
MAETALDTQRKKEGRGKFLTTILVLHSFIALLVMLFFIDRLFIHGNISALMNINILSGIIGFVILILLIISAPLIWTWNKFGAYGLILLFIVWLLEYFIYELPNYLTLADQTNTLPELIIFQTLWLYVALSILYFWALKRKWHLFSL